MLSEIKENVKCFGSLWFHGDNPLTVTRSPCEGLDARSLSHSATHQPCEARKGTPAPSASHWRYDTSLMLTS